MGAVGSTIANAIDDIFYPDNPSRRRRVLELRQQVLNYGDTFNGLTAGRDEVLVKVGSMLNARIQDLTGAGADQYPALKQKLGLIDGNVVRSSLLDIASVQSSQGFDDIFSAIGGILGDSLTGSDRELLRTFISLFFHMRGLSRMYVDQMRVLRAYLARVERWLMTPAPGEYEAIMGYDLAAAMQDCGLQQAYTELNQLDRADGSWTNEDPQPINGVYAGPTAAQPLIFDPTQPSDPNAPSSATFATAQIVANFDGAEKDMELALEKVLDRSTALVNYQGQVQKLSATVIGSVVNLQNVTFSLSPWTDGTVQNVAAFRQEFQVKSFQSSER